MRFNPIPAVGDLEVGGADCLDKSPRKNGRPRSLAG